MLDKIIPLKFIQFAGVPETWLRAVASRQGARTRGNLGVKIRQGSVPEIIQPAGWTSIAARVNQNRRAGGLRISACNTFPLPGEKKSL